jgi:hypothetical protein
MADVIYDKGSGIPPEQGGLYKNMPDGSFAQVGLAIAGFAPLQSLTAVSTVQNGLVMDNVGVRNNHSIVVVANGTVTGGGPVQLQGSQDGVNWINLLIGTGVFAPVTPAGPGPPNVFLGIAQLTPFRFLRAAIITGSITGGGTISAWISSAG